MNQNKLQQKRRKRQAKRKQAQARARRHSLALRDKQNKDFLKSKNAKPAIMSQGTQITPDQPDAEAAPLITGGR